TDDGVNRFLLYFHSLNATDDLVTMSTDPNYEIYTASQNYQEFESNNKDLQQKLSLINSDKKAQDTAVQVLTPYLNLNLLISWDKLAILLVIKEILLLQH
ncbi:hypothetical protein, partial [Escherichia coli]|uniref:hypothetical protein n=1 Tax=Escherichia coli TaxID=562 RepID=UPI003FA588AA